MLINELIIECIAKRLIKFMDPNAIYLFGSLVWGNPDENSDIDLMILVNEYIESRLKLTAKAYKEIRDYSMYPTDLLIRTSAEFNEYSMVEGSLNNKILTKGIKLYEKQADFNL